MWEVHLYSISLLRSIQRSRYCLVIYFIFIGFVMSAQDTTAPVITTPASNASVVCGGSQNTIAALTNWYNNQGGAVASDDVGVTGWQSDLTIEQVISIFNSSSDTLCGRTRNVLVLFRAFDTAGNFSPSTTASFSAIDTIGPVITNEVPNISLSCTATTRDSLIAWIQSHAGYIATDVCSDQVTWTTFVYQISSNGTIIDPGTEGSIANGPYPQLPTNVCNWVMNISFNVVDECGNISGTVGTTTFSVVDNVAPDFVNPPSNITINCTASSQAATLTATDACSPSVTVNVSTTSTQSTDINACQFYNYTVTHTWEATDNCNNKRTHTQVITVRDTLKPTISGQVAINIPCEVFNASPDSIYLTSWTDQCDIEPKLTFTDIVTMGRCMESRVREYTLADACNNQQKFTQTITIPDSNGPRITKPAKNYAAPCEISGPIEVALSAWLDTLGGAKATSICGGMKSFAAVKGSYNKEDASSFPGTRPSGLGSFQCPSPIEGFLRYVEVDFVFYDTCGNATVTSAVFGSSDDKVPIFTSCPAPISVTVDDDQCDAQVLFDLPLAVDLCTESASPLTRTIVTPVRSASPGNIESIVDTTFVNIGPFQPSTIPLGDGNLEILLRNMDIDDVTEYFLVYGEDNQLLTQTVGGDVSGQCANHTTTVQIPLSKLSSWIQDGFIRLQFAPNIIPGIPTASINDICSASSIEVKLSYPIDIVNTLRKFLSIDGGNLTDVTSQSTFDRRLSVGIHTVDIYAVDCAGNEGVCRVDVEVTDQVFPQIFCPQSIEVALAKDSCNENVTIDLTDVIVSDNCKMAQDFSWTAPASNDGALVNFTFNPQFNRLTANNKQIIFNNVRPLKYSDGDIKLTIAFEGDNNDLGEFWTIVGPGGIDLGKTNIRVGQADCGQVMTDFIISKSQFNTWANTGQITIFAIPNDAIGAQGLGINPCTPINPSMTVDGVSTLKATFSYSDAPLSYLLSGATSQDLTEIDPIANNLIINAYGGNTNLILFTEDDAGNQMSCTSIITVLDTQTPKANCKDINVTIHPSGVISTLIKPSDINNVSKDNCYIDTMFVRPREISCVDVGKVVDVSLYVVDAQGNVDSCISKVTVKPTELKPTYESGLCSTDTIRLFANLPDSGTFNGYNFEWKGPFSFFTENPVIEGVDESYNGTYVLTVTGAGGCVSKGSINVNVKPLINPKLESIENTVCESDSVILNMTNYVGNIRYKWYEGIAPNGVLIADTDLSTIAIKPTIGVHFYYTVAEGVNCKSNPSNLLKITVLKQPIAEVKDRLLTPCEGDDIILGSPVVNPNYTYIWNGPGYSATGQNPPIINNASLENAGVYTLVITNDICISDTATTTIEIFDTPDQPTLSALQIYCAGAIVNMVANNAPDADKYEWYKDNVLFTTTVDNALTLPNAQLALQGRWKVRAFEGTCASPFSSDMFIAIEELLQFGAANNGPICEGDSTQLLATFIPNAIYTWDGPDPNVMIPSIHDPKIAAVAGEYSVTITTASSCNSNATTTVVVIPRPSITALSSNATNCLAIGSDVTFFPSVFPNDPSFVYQWNGPNGFNDSVKNAIIDDVTQLDTGKYSLTVLNQGCKSNTFTIDLDFIVTPAQPVVTAPAFICLGDTLKINITNPSQGVSYQWATPNSGLVTTISPFIEITNPTSIHNGTYTVTAKRGDCLSTASLPITIEVRPRPSKPVVTTDLSPCYGSDITLETNVPAAGFIFDWKKGSQSIGSTKVITLQDVDKSTNGSYTLQVVKDGCISPISDAINILVKDSIATPSFELPSKAICISDTKVDICALANSLHPGSTLVLKDAQSSVLASNDDRCISLTDLTQLKSGANFLYLINKVGDCESDRSKAMVLSLLSPPDIKANIVEGDRSVCPDELVILTAASNTGEVDITWKAIGGQHSIDSPTNVSTAINNLQGGLNRVVLTYSVEGCFDFTSDTANIIIAFEPILAQDVYTLQYGQNGKFGITTNDVIPSGSTIKLIQNPKNGVAKIVNDSLIYTPDPRFISSEIMTYEICPDGCPDLCVQTNVIIDFTKDIPCQIPNLLSPNGDGINDLLIIPCLGESRYPDSRITIFNEWGHEVFNDQPYQNDWDGRYGGNPLPVGTYFVVLQLADDIKPIHQFIMIQR
jgi:gliding motility-associated-like protein